MEIAYVVLYVDDAELCRRFWIEQVGMVERSRKDVDGVSIVQVGFDGQSSMSLELVPRVLVADNPYGLDLGTPSMCMRVTDLQAAHAELSARGVSTSPIGEHSGTLSFAFSDPEGRWFAVAL